jgi:hypothetical protein
MVVIPDTLGMNSGPSSFPPQQVTVIENEPTVAEWLEDEELSGGQIAR